MAQLLSGVEAASGQEPNSYLMLLAVGIMSIAVVIVVCLFLKFATRQNEFTGKLFDQSNDNTERSTAAIERSTQAMMQSGRLTERCTVALERIVQNGNGHGGMGS
jgi:hypothetical protein